MICKTKRLCVELSYELIRTCISCAGNLLPPTFYYYYYYYYYYYKESP